MIACNGLSSATNIGDYQVACIDGGATARRGAPVLLASSALAACVSAAWANFAGPPVSRFGDYNALLADPAKSGFFRSFVELAAADPACLGNPNNRGVWTTMITESQVPEPGSLALFMLAVSGALAFRGRRC